MTQKPIPAFHILSTHLAPAEADLHGQDGAPESAAGTAPDAPESPAGSAPRGRPSGYAPRIIDMMCEKIRAFGLSDTAAAEALGMSSSRISRWKQQFPEIGPKLQQARQDIRF